ncbi:MAG TPA: HAD family hydrolase [Alphaproteobacteria bacterium]|nr:HAD family hydrolase [Alphaproteobacteria bacterium]
MAKTFWPAVGGRAYISLATITSGAKMEQGLKKRRGLLLDRDGVINADRGYVVAREQFAFMPGVFPFLRAARDHGFRLAILTNQSGVARGLYRESDYESLTAWMLGQLAGEGISIDLTLASFEHPEGTVAAYTRQSFWRKPNPGMVLEAVQRLRLDPARSAFLGDKASDMEAAKAGGIGTCLYLMPAGTDVAENAKIIKNLDEAIETLRTIASSLAS